MEATQLIEPLLQHHRASSHPQFLIAAYRYVFGRGIDEKGYNHYLTQLYAGRPRAELLREWFRSPEFQYRDRALPALPEPPAPPAPPPPRDQLEQYQDIWIRGRCVAPGRRECAERFQLIAEFCQRYQRPFTILDLGANLAYFSIRLTEQFPHCTAVACEGIYGDWTREILAQNDNPRVILLHHTFRLDDLRALSEVEHFDVVLALSVVHHLDGSFAESLAVLRSLGDHLILELPTEADACGQPIVEEIRQASLPADAQLLGHGRSHLGGAPRPIYLLSQPKTQISKSYLGTPRTGLHVTIESDFRRKQIRFHNKPEHRDWLPGINLHTYLWFNGQYPRAGWIADQLQDVPLSNRHRDVQPWNVILGDNTARLIDADDPNHAFHYSDEDYRQRLIHLLRLVDAAQLSRQRPATSPRLPVRWCGPVFNPSGYASEAINFLIPLAKRLTLGLEHHNNLYSEAFVRGLPADERRTLLALRERFTYLNGAILIAHNPAPGFRDLPDAPYRIGRTMFETDRLPADWVTACNRMDEIWVPSRSNVETFTRAGVEPDLLHVIPEAVDHEVFDPARHDPLPLPNRAAFNFLAIFEWSSRKAWDVLLSAYLREFSAEDDVCLYLRTYLFGQPDDNPRETLWQLIRDHAATLNLGNKPWPRIELLTEQIPTADLPRLYRAVDCLVAPSRGEGWGRPQHEAMLMGLPVIATNWSAPTEFMTHEVAYLLDYELVDIRIVEPELWHYRGHRWANPSESHLRQLMRHVQQHPDEARARGRAARLHMVQHYDRDTVANLVVQRLIEIERRLTSAVCPPAPTRVATAPAAAPARAESQRIVRIAWQGAAGDAGSLAHVNRELTHRLARLPGVRLKAERPDLT
ncbi:MAG: glycosyltransferase, partial [Verrucomicrobiae bacterium]|nr:glycosyltransferase [Verrucomicrobiae bacterium]